MNPHISAVILGVKDLNRAKQFYSEGLGWPIQLDAGQFIAFNQSDGSSKVALYPRDVLADDAGVPPDGSGFPGITFNYIVRSDERVNEVLADAERARRDDCQAGSASPVGRLFRLLRGPRGISLEGRVRLRRPALR